jgi:hypothetical protein
VTEFNIALDFKGALAPRSHGALELLIAGVVDRKFLSPKPGKAAGHVGEESRCEPSIFLDSKFEKAIETKASLDCHQVNEVASFSSTEDGEYLVDCQLLAR